MRRVFAEQLVLTPRQSDVRQSAAAGTASRQIWDMLSFSAVPDELRDADTPCGDWANPPWPASTGNRERWSALDVLPRDDDNRHSPLSVARGGRGSAAEERHQPRQDPAKGSKPPSVHPIHLSHLMFVFLRDGRWSRTTAGNRIEKPFVLKWDVFSCWRLGRTILASSLTACCILVDICSAQQCPLSRGVEEHGTATDITFQAAVTSSYRICRLVMYKRGMRTNYGHTSDRRSG